MGVVGELCMSPLCSSSFFSSFFPVAIFSVSCACSLFSFMCIRLTFDDAWYVKIAHLSHPQAVFTNPPTISRPVFDKDPSSVFFHGL